MWRIVAEGVRAGSAEVALNGLVCLDQMSLESRREEGLELMPMVTEHALARAKK